MLNALLNLDTCADSKYCFDNQTAEATWLHTSHLRWCVTVFLVSQRCDGHVSSVCRWAYQRLFSAVQHWTIKQQVECETYTPAVSKVAEDFATYSIWCIKVVNSCVQEASIVEFGRTQKNLDTFSRLKATTLFMLVDCGVLTERLCLLTKSIIQSFPAIRFLRLKTWLILLPSANS